MAKRCFAERFQIAGILKRLASQIGARVVLEPNWNVAGQIIFPNGRIRYFRWNTLDLNPVGASDISKDKDYAAFFMRSMGYPAIPGETFFSDRWAKAIHSNRTKNAALRYAKRTGFPLVAKPNSNSHGHNVFFVHNERELKRALKEIFTEDKVALIQKPVIGHDYRVVVLDDAIISAYERIPLNVVGDGKSSIEQLLARKKRTFKSMKRDSPLQLDDPRIALKLIHQKLTLASIPPKGKRVFLLDNANLSSGGDSVDVTDAMHPEFKRIAIQLTRDMGLRLCGVDLMIEGTISEAPNNYHIIEINAAPGLDHYVTTGPAQQKIVEDLYLKVLKSLEH